MPAESRPVFIARGERPMFAWHHVPAAEHRRNAAVVLCPPLGYEYMSTYATWKTLAGRLASAGFDTLRIDYDGTGNSAGDGAVPGRLDAWRRSVEDAIDEARRVTGAASVALVGLRAGALIALDAAAARPGVDRVVLWNPFASGRAYLRELKAEIALARETDAAEEPLADGMNVSGYLLTDDTVKALEHWTLDRLGPGLNADVLLVDRDDRPAPAAVETGLTNAGARVTKICGDGTAAMLQLPHLAVIPEALLDRIVEWLSTPAAAPAPDVPLAQPASIGSEVWCGDGWTERALRFGAGNRLFGVLTAPEHPAADAPALILLNTAVEYHIGPHRMYVPLAREHAAQGRVVLRFDLDGIGDSEAAPGQPPNESFPDGMLDDLRDAVALVRRDAPARPVIVAGLCSGGWLAIDAARQGVGIDAFVAINPPLFLRDNAGREWVTHGAELERYQQSVWHPAKWMGALRRPGVGITVIRVLAKTILRRTLAAIARLRRTPQPGTLAADLASIAARGIQGHFVFSRGDAGLAYLQLHAATALRRKNIRRFVACTVVDGAGHTFRPQAAQAVMRRLIDEAAARRRFAPLVSSLYPSRNTLLLHQVLDATPPSC
jgi:alpha-beta hydrolase superfamily lysophospholipase